MADGLGLRPLDACIKHAMIDPNVVQLLLALPSGAAGVKRPAPGGEEPVDKGTGKGPRAKAKAKAKAAAKAKGKGPGKGDKTRPAARLPNGLEGTSVTPAGLSICFSYNFNKCSAASCPKGEHVCTKCFGQHAFLDCKMAGK